MKGPPTWQAIYWKRNEKQHGPGANLPEAHSSFVRSLRQLLLPLASLKLTVALFAMAIFIVFTGTLAQIDKDIWEVMGDYFRTPVAWIELQVFVPRSMHVPGGFYFPGGFAIGLAMLVNLVAAHSLRFTIQARGIRLAAGLAAAALGVGMTWLVIVSGSNSEGLQSVPLVSWATLWMWCKVGLAGIWIALMYCLWRIDPKRTLDRSLLAVATISLGALLGWLLFRANDAALGDSSMRILWQLIKGGLASLVLLGGCALLFRKRAGIVLLHAGVALMMANELVVYSLHAEGQMTIAEGQSIDYVEDTRTVELAVIDHSDPDNDVVVVVPETIVRGGEVIRHDALPFDIQVVEYFPNSGIRRVRPGEENPATEGIGRSYVAEEARHTAGADTDGQVDTAAAYVRLTAKNAAANSLGTHMLAVPRWLQVNDKAFEFLGVDTVNVGGHPYDIALRFRRNYKPYSLRLKDVRFDKYMGTETAKNYSSEVHLVDPSRHVDRDVKIWMNNPLRFAGETFYQSGFHVRPNSFVECTVLQVVKNTGWMIPYVACMIVAAGMLAQFSVVLLRFLNRRSSGEVASTAPASPGAAADRSGRVSVAMRGVNPAGGGARVWLDRLFPCAVVLLCAGWLVSKAVPPRAADDTFHFEEFGKLPLVYQGRVKPFDTLGAELSARDQRSRDVRRQFR